MNNTAMSAAPATAGIVSLADQIKAEHDACLSSASDALSHAIRCGELLIQAKAKISHGQWQQWLAENFPASRRTAQAYMRLGAEQNRLPKAQGVALMTIGDALRSLADHRLEPGELPDLSRGDIWYCLGRLGEHRAVVQLEQSQQHRGCWYAEVWYEGSDESILTMRPLKMDVVVGGRATIETWMQTLSFEGIQFERCGEWQEATRENAIIPLIDEAVRSRAYVLHNIQLQANSFAEALDLASTESGSDQ